MSESGIGCQPYDLMQHESDRVGTDWAYLSDLVEVNPRSPSPTDGETVSFVAMADVSESGVIASMEMREASSGYTPFVVGDVLVAKITPCFENGKGAHVKGMPTRCGLGSTEFHVLRPHSTTSDRYLYHLTRTSRFRLQGESLMSGSAGQQRVPTEFFGRYTVRMPPLEEQRRIAEILDTIDEAIQTAERIVAKLRVVEIGVLRAALKAEAPTSRQSTVQQEFEIVTGIALNAGRVPRSNPVGYLRVANVHRGEIDISDLAMLEATEDEVKRKGLAAGDLLVVEGHANPGEIGRCALVPESADGLLFQNHLFRLRSGSMIPDVAELILNSAEARGYWRRMCATSSGLHTINSSMLRAMPISVPDLDHQLNLLELSNAVDTPISTELKRLAKLRKLRSGLAADLLSGRVRTVAA